MKPKKTFSIIASLFLTGIVIFYLYPFPSVLWSVMHTKDINRINSFTSAVNGEHIFNGFKNSEIGPSKIELYYIGTTPFTKNEFFDQLSSLTSSSISKNSAHRENLNSIIDYDIGCTKPISGVMKLGKQEFEAYTYLFTDDKGRKVSASYYPVATDDEIFCNGKRLETNIFEIYIETLKRSPF